MFSYLFPDSLFVKDKLSEKCYKRTCYKDIISGRLLHSRKNWFGHPTRFPSSFDTFNQNT